MGKCNIVKVKQYLDIETGEYLSESDVAMRYYGVVPFWKLNKDKFAKLLKRYDGKQKDVLVYIIENINQRDNSFKATYKKMSRDILTSEVTIAKAMVRLQEDKFITMESYGLWVVNADYLVKGDEAKRIGLVRKFFDLWRKRDIMKKGHTNASRKVASNGESDQ